MHGIRDPEELREDAAVEFREQERVVDGAEFETVSEGAESQSGLVVVGVTNDGGELLLVDSEYVDGWTLPNGPVGVDDDWAIAADRWSEDALELPVEIGAPKLVIRTETRSAETDESVVGYTVAFGASMPRGAPGSGFGQGGPPASGGPGGPPQGEPSGPGDVPGGAPEGAGGAGGPAGAPAGPGDISDRPDLEWFAEVPDDVAPGHDALIQFFLD